MKPNHPSEFAPGLAPLSPQEREVLALLAKGHTAKSIAVLTGRSVASVNERLRQARRKTGAPSSRELARRFAAQENRDEQIDLVAHQAAPQPAGLSTSAKGVIAMAGLLLTGVAAAFLVAQQTPAPSSKRLDDPLIDGMLPPSEQDPRRLAEQIRAEPRDIGWAEPAEAALRARYAPLIEQRRIKVARISCAATVCEMVGNGLEKNIKQADRTWRELQDPKQNTLPEAVRLKWTAMIFGNGGFIAYWTRES